MKKKFYITTPLYYVNDVPHIGHAYTTIAADILARFHKSLGEDVFFLTGTDEHGQKILDAAEKRKLTPRQFVNTLVPTFKNAWRQLNVNYDHFIRTTDKAHEETAKKFFKLLLEKGEIYEGTYSGLYCVGCENYVTEKDLVGGRCPLHDRAPSEIKEKGYFFRLSKYQDALQDLYEQCPDFVRPAERFNELKNRVQEGLQDWFISRKVWGIDIPGEKDLKIYVWFEALLNYISALGWPSGAKFKKYWPADAHLMAKDIHWFHAVVWPAMLLAAGERPPQCVFAHGYFTVDGQKMSKTIGNVVDPIKMSEKYSADALRYILFKETPFGQDGNFSERTLVERYNSELANELGNLVSRSLTMIEKYSEGKVPSGSFDNKIKSLSEKAIIGAGKDLQDLEIHEALERIWEFIRAVNKYVQDSKPWEKPKNLSEILYSLAESLRIISALVWPFIPQTAEKIAKQLGLKGVPKLADAGKRIKAGTKIKKGEILFPHTEFKEVPKEDAFAHFDFRVGKITKVEDVKGADKLYKLIVNFGAAERQVIAGIKSGFSQSDLLGRQTVFLANIEPVKLRGLLSEAMILVAQSGKAFELLGAGKGKPGDSVCVEGIASKPAKAVSLKEFKELALRVINHNAEYKCKPLTVGAENINTSKIKEAVIV